MLLLDKVISTDDDVFVTFKIKFIKGDLLLACLKYYVGSESKYMRIFSTVKGVRRCYVIFVYLIYYNLGAHSIIVVKALCYRPEGHGLKTRRSE
jgi:hypothetical protein